MTWIIYIVTVLIVFAIAAGTVGRETHRLDSTSPAPAFELVDAVDWIAERLPTEVSAQISYEDVRDLVSWHLESLQASGVTERIGGNDELVIVDDQGAIDELLTTARSAGREFSPDHVRAVLDGELSYLLAIGAVGPLADPTTEL